MLCSRECFDSSDINECSSSSLHGCEQLCVNTEGTYGCACRDGYALDSNNGRTCSLDCGGRLTGTSGSFHTPGWPERYPQLDFRCVWTVDSIPEQHSAVFVVDDSAYGINGAPPCRTDYIEFFDSADHNGASLGKHCMLEVPDPVRISTDGARVVFQGRRNSNRPANRVGTRVFYYIDGELNYLAHTFTYLSSSCIILNWLCPLHVWCVHCGVFTIRM